MRDFTTAVAVLAALALGACATATGDETLGAPKVTTVSTTGGATVAIESQPTTGGRSATIAAAPERVWEVLPAVYQGLGVTVGTINPAARVLGNTSLRLNRRLGGEPVSRFVECGTTATGFPIADAYRVEMSVMTGVAPMAPGSRVETHVNAQAVNPSVSGAPVHCTTTGRLEQLIADRVKAHLNV